MIQKQTFLNRGYELFLVPGVLVFFVLIVAPFIANVAVSFTEWTGIGDPVWVGLENYQRAFGDAIFWASFRNNLTLIIGMTIVPTLVGLLLAVFLFDYIAKNFGQTVASIFRAGIYLPQIVPVVVAAIVWKWIFQPDWGALNYVLNALGLEGHNWLGDQNTALNAVMIMLIWFQIGYPLVIFMAGLQRIDPELNEAAAIDGATWWNRFTRITIPLLRPEIFVVVLTTTISALKTFGPIYAMTRGGPGNATIVASYFAYKNFFEVSRVGYAATMATVLTVIVVALTLAFLSIQSRQEQRELIS